jgi:hypothetical protein
MMSSEQPVEKRGTGATYVQVTGWGRGETDSNFGIHRTAIRYINGIDSFSKSRRFSFRLAKRVKSPQITDFPPLREAHSMDG